MMDNINNMKFNDSTFVKKNNEKINKKDEELAKKYLEERDFTFEMGYAIDTDSMNPDEYQEIMFVGETLDKAISEYVRKTTWWVYNPSDGQQVFENIWDAVEYAEENSDVSFDKFKQNRR